MMIQNTRRPPCLPRQRQLGPSAGRTRADALRGPGSFFWSVLQYHPRRRPRPRWKTQLRYRVQLTRPNITVSNAFF